MGRKETEEVSGEVSVKVDDAVIDATLGEGIGLDVIHMTQQCQNGLAMQTY